MPGLLIKALIAGSRDLQQPVELLRRKVVIEKVNRVEAGSVLMHFVVAMRGGALSGTAYPANNFPAFYLFTILYFDLIHVAVKGFISIAMVDNHVVAIAIGQVA